MDYFANWLFDRASTLYQLAFRSGEMKYLREAHRATQFYASKITDTGYFGLKIHDDAKYVYGESLLSNYVLQADDDLPGTLAKMLPVWDGINTNFTAELNFWTERHSAYKLIGYVTAYELLGESEIADKAVATFDDLREMQVNPVEGYPMTGALMRTSGQGAEGGDFMVASPWMSTLLLDAVERFYLHSGDDRVPDFVMQMADYFKQDGIAIHTKSFAGHEYTYPYYLAGEEYRRDDYSDWEHSIDVAKIMASAYYFSRQQGEANNEYLETMSKLYSTQMNLTFKHWMRTTAPALGYTAYRMSPPRKFSWWFRTTSNMDFLVGEDAKLNAYDGVSKPQLSLVQDNIDATHFSPGDEFTFNFTLKNTGTVAANNVSVVVNTLDKSGKNLQVINLSEGGGMRTRIAAWKFATVPAGSTPIKLSMTVKVNDFAVLQSATRPLVSIVSHADVRYCGDISEEGCVQAVRGWDLGKQPYVQQSNWQVIDPALPVTTPELNIVSHNDGANVTGLETFVAHVSDADGINKVDFYIDDVLLKTTTQAPYSVTYQADSLSDAEHEFKVEAFDNIGSVAKKSITITPINPDVVEPTVMINSPVATNYNCQAIDVDYEVKDSFSTASCQLVLGDIAVDLSQCQNYQLPMVPVRLKSKLALAFEGTGNVIKDSSIFSSDGELMKEAMRSVTSGAINGTDTGKTMIFDGEDDYLKFTDHQLDITNEVTVAFWMNPTSDESVIMSQDWAYIGAEQGWAISLGANNHESNNARSITWSSHDRSGNDNTSTVVQTDGNVITLNSWQHVAITKKDKEVVIYINGVETKRGEVKSANIAWPPLSKKPFMIGLKMPHPTMYQNYYHGQLDDVLIWNESLSADEIEQLVTNSPSVGTHSLTINATDPAGNVGSATVDYNVQACQ